MSDLRQSLREYATKLANSREYQRGAPDMRQHGDRMLAECLTFENEILADRDRLAAELDLARCEHRAETLLRKGLSTLLEQREAELSAARADAERYRNGLRFYAHGLHCDFGDPADWDTVSGEPNNFLCDEHGSTIEDGTIAKIVLLGVEKFDPEDWPPEPLPEESAVIDAARTAPSAGSARGEG